MNIIGRFQPTADGYAGVLRTLTVDRELRIVETRASQQKAPSHRVLMDERECGVAWTPGPGEAGVLHLKLEDPSFPRALRGVLVRGEGDECLLLWRRPSSG